MKKASLLQKVAGLAVLGSIAFADGDPTVTMPTPDYTNFYAAVSLALGITVVVMLARKAKSFLRS